MKPKHKQNEYNLFSSKPKAVQGRTSLQRVREDLRRRSVRIVLSPVSHYSPFKSPRTSITNLSPRRSILLRRSISQAGSTSANQLIEKLLTPRNKKQRRCTKRLNEAEKLQEELLSKKYIADGNIFGSKRALRSRLILTPKSPLVRVKKTYRQTASSRKISFNSLNKYLSRDVRIELERLSREEEPLDRASQVEDSEPGRDDENNQIFRVSGKKVQPIEITINLEKLSPSITRRYSPEETDQIPGTSSVQSEDVFLGFPTNDRQTSEIPRKPKYGPILDVRIELEKLPDTDSDPETETPSVELSEEQVEIPQIEDVSENMSIESIDIVSENVVTENISIESLEKEPEKVDDIVKDGQTTEEPQKEPSTPTRETVPEQMPVSVTPTVTSELVSTPISTPEPGIVENTEMSGKKTPRSLDIPLRRITIVKSKFKKMNQVLESPNKVSPIKVRPNSTYLASPLNKPKPSKQKNPSIQDTTSSSNLETSTVDNVSLPNSTMENMISDDSSRSSTSSSLSSVSPPTPEAGISSQIKPVYIRKTLLTSSDWTFGMGKLTTKSSNKANVEVANEIPKKTAASVENTKSTSVKTPPSVPSVSVCTEVSSPLSRGQLLTSKSLARSPHAPQLIVGKSPSHLARSPKPDSGKKTYPKSPLHRGRLLTEQSLAASPKNQNSGILDKKISRSASAGSSLHRSNSNVSSSPKDRQVISYGQKWSSASDLLKSSSMDTESNSSGDSSPVASPLDSTSVTGIFSNSKTCTAILSTLKPTDRDKSKSEPSKLTQWSASDVAKPLPPKKTPDSAKIQAQDRKSESRSQSDLSQKLSGVKIDSTYSPDSQSSYLSSIQKKPFHIPKVKPGISNFYKTFSASPSNLPRSGFTPSPPTKSSITRPVLDKMYASPHHSATAHYRHPPPKSSQSSYKSWTKPTTTSSFKTPTTKPFYSSSSHSSTIKTTYTSSTQTASTQPHSSASTSQISHSQTLTKPSPSSSIQSPFKPPYPVTSQSSYTKSSYTAGSHSTTAKPQHSTNSQFQFVKPAPLTFIPPSQPPYVPPKPTTQSQTPSSIPTPTKSLPVKPLTNSKSPKSKSKSRPFKTAYMSSRSSNTPSYSKCLPSGPQYSPTYSKYLQNGFSRLPTAQYKMPKPTRPVSPGTKDVLRWSTVKPWMSKKPASPPIGPSGSLMSSTVTSDPSYSPLCPNYEI